MNRPAVEPDRVPVGRVLAAVGGLLGLLILSAVLLGWWYGAAGGAAFRGGQERGQPSGAARLQVDPARDLEALTAAKTAWLNSYGWVDRQAGVVRAPIDAAMDRYLDSGWETLAPFPRMERAAAERRPGAAGEEGR